MYQTQKNNVTYIDDLPDLTDLESGGHGGNRENMPSHHVQEPDQYSKFIRPTMGPPHNQSGMAPQQPPPPEFFQPPPQQLQQEAPMRPASNSPTCLEIADHVMACPICSIFYKNDNTIYIVSIIVLAIICILLLKKVLGV